MEVVELYAGGGGAALGLHRAGFDHRQLVERWEPAAATLESATGGDLFGRPHPAWGEPAPGLVYRGDVRRWTPWAADLWWASPPCQPGSTLGRRQGPADARDGLGDLLEHLQRLQRARPRWVVVETVTGTTEHETDHGPSCPGCHWQRFAGLLARLYPATTQLVLDARDHGVPQSRSRVFLVGGPSPIAAPPATHGPGCPTPWVPMLQALGITEGTWLWKPGATGAQRRIPGTLPAPCVTASEAKGACTPNHRKLQRASDALYIETGRRVLTVREALILQGMPEDWPVRGSSQADRLRIVGNMVPPQLSEAIGRAILAA